MDSHRVKFLRLYGSVQQVTVGSRVYNPNLAVSLEVIIYIFPSTQFYLTFCYFQANIIVFIVDL